MFTISQLRILAAGALCLSGICAPPGRADIFVSNGAGNPSSSHASSFSWYTGAPKLTFTGGLVSSEGVAIGPDGNLYVADGGTGAVLRFNPLTGALIGTFAAAASPSTPYGITFGPDGNLYMADGIGVIRRFDGSTGAPTGTFPCSTPSAGTCYPFGLTFGPDGNLYVSDLNSSSVLKFNGGTLAFVSVFVPPVAALSLPWGLHFGPNGNLYVVWATILDVQGAFTTSYNILAFNGTSGAAQAGFETSSTGAFDFAFGPDQEIYTAAENQFFKFSSSTGSFLNAFSSNPGLEDAQTGFIVFGPGGIPPYLIFDPVSAAPTQTLRITVIDGPIRVPPGVPVQAQLGFQNSAGAPVGPSTVVNLNPGQTAFLDLDASTLISSGRILLQPVVTAVPGAPLGNIIGGSLSGSLEIYNTGIGVGSVFYPGIPVPPVSNITGPASFVPQGVAHGQSIQIDAAAPPDSPCAALLSFEDIGGNRVGPEQNVNLSPGTMASLSFNANAHTKLGRQEFVPLLVPSNPAGAPGAASACLGAVEVYSQHTGDTATYQTLLPPIGTPPAVP